MARTLLEADLAQKVIDTTCKSGKNEFSIMQLVHAHVERSRNTRELDQVMKSSTNYDSLYTWQPAKTTQDWRPTF